MATEVAASSSAVEAAADAPEVVSATTTPPPGFPVPIPLRGVDYRGKLVLAPMVRSGELPCRLLALHYGADLVWGPETVDYSMIGTTRRTNPRTGMLEWTRFPTNTYSKAEPGESVIYRLDPVREAKKLIFQIGTADPGRAVAAAHLVAADVSGIDVNAGCPKPFSTSGGMGAALLQTPDKLVAILEALVREITPRYQIGISVKIRLLETPAETETLVRRLVKTGITGLTIHCRTTPMRPRERALRGQLRMIADLCREAGVACLVNGDVENRDHADELTREYGCDGAMIATAAEKNPSCFRSGKELASWRDNVRHYLRFAMEAENKLPNTKFSLTQLVPGREPEYKLLCSCKSYSSIIEHMRLDEELKEMAGQTDEAMQLGKWAVPPPPKQPKASKRQLQKEQKDAESRKRKREGDGSEGKEAKKSAAEQAAAAVAEASQPAVAAAVSV